MSYMTDYGYMVHSEALIQLVSYIACLFVFYIYFFFFTKVSKLFNRKQEQLDLQPQAPVYWMGCTEI